MKRGVRRKSLCGRIVFKTKGGLRFLPNWFRRFVAGLFMMGSPVESFGVAFEKGVEVILLFLFWLKAIWICNGPRPVNVLRLLWAYLSVVALL